MSANSHKGTDEMASSTTGTTVAVATSSQRPVRKPIKLSICLITYNRARYLNLALADMFRSQPFDFAFEVVICDNHSTDDTPKIVADWQSRHPEIRSVRQKSNVGPAGNMATAYRLSKGEFCVYLADDDRLVPEQVAAVIRYMETNSNIVVCHAPWEYWDDLHKEVRGQFYKLPEEKVFSKGSAVELFNMLVQLRLLPEICIYRSSVLHRMYTLPYNAYWAFVHLAHALDYGDVAFLPKPFYRQLVLGDIPKSIEHAGLFYSVHHRDSFVSGFEYFAQKAFRYLGVPHVPPGQVEQLQKMIVEFGSAQLEVCVRLLTDMKNFRGAYEFVVRQQANGRCPDEKAAELRPVLMMRAAIQGFIETFEGISVAEQVALYGFPDPEHWRTLLLEQRPSMTVRFLTKDTLGHIEHPERIFVMTAPGSDIQPLIAAGFMPGFLIDQNDLARLYTL